MSGLDEQLLRCVHCGEYVFYFSSPSAIYLPYLLAYNKGFSIKKCIGGNIEETDFSKKMNHTFLLKFWEYVFYMGSYVWHCRKCHKTYDSSTKVYNELLKKLEKEL